MKCMVRKTVLVTAIGIASALSGLAGPGPGAPVSAAWIEPFVPNVDVNGNRATSPDTPLGNTICADLGEDIMPIVDPNGNPVTLAQYTRVSGTATAKCAAQGTHIVVHLTGLIPNG